MSRTFEQLEVGTRYRIKGNPYIYRKITSTKKVIDWTSTIGSLPIGSEESKMEKYFLQLAENGREDTNRNGIKVFKVGEGDVDKFPELLRIYEVWIMKSGKVQLISIDSMSNYKTERSFYETENRLDSNTL